MTRTIAAREWRAQLAPFRKNGISDSISSATTT